MLVYRDVQFGGRCPCPARVFLCRIYRCPLRGTSIYLEGAPKKCGQSRCPTFTGLSRSLEVMRFDRATYKAVTVSPALQNTHYIVQVEWGLRGKVQYIKFFEWLSIKTLRSNMATEMQARGTSRSLEMSPFDRAHMICYWCSVVTMALSHVIPEIFSVEKKIKIKGQSWSLKLVPCDRLGMVSYWCSIVTLSLKRTVFETSKMSWPWNPGYGSHKIIGTDTNRSATYDFLLTLPSNHEPISYRFQDKWRFQSKITNFSQHRVFITEIGYRRLGQKN